MEYNLLLSGAYIDAGQRDQHAIALTNKARKVMCAHHKLLSQIFEHIQVVCQRNARPVVIQIIQGHRHLDHSVLHYVPILQTGRYCSTLIEVEKKFEQKIIANLPQDTFFIFILHTTNNIMIICRQNSSRL